MELQWPLILFTSLLAWSAGTFTAQAVYALKGEGAKAQLPALICSAVLLIAGGIAVFFHLQHWERIFNGFGHITSGITQELIAIVLVAVVMVIYFVFLRKSKQAGNEGTVPAWCAIVAIIVAVVLVCAMGHSYEMPSRPAWNTLIGPLSLIGAAAGSGFATMAALDHMRSAEPSELSRPANIAGTLINLLGVGCYLAAFAGTGSSVVSLGMTSDPTTSAINPIDYSAVSPFAGDALAPSIIAIVCAIAAVALVFAAKKTGWKVMGWVIAILVIVSAVALRVVFYHMGISVFNYF